MDINPFNEGHALLIPKEHFSRLEDCSGSVMSALAQQIPTLVGAILKAVRAEGCNIVNNNGRCAGQLVDHIHFHIIPRRQGDGVVQYGPHSEYPEGRMSELADQIREHLPQ